MKDEKIIEGEVAEEKSVEDLKNELQKKRVEEFQKEVTETQKKHGFEMYAVNAITNGGEIIPVIKLKDLK